MNKNILVLFVISFFSLTVSGQTYTEDIAEIIYNKCTTCHRSGEIGPMSFTNYDEVKDWAQTIKYVTQIGYMPPWKADPQYSRFLGENYLTQDEINTIAAWVDGGTVQGPASAEPNLPDFPNGSLLGEPDLVLTFAQEHTHIGNNRDEYRYFVLPTGLTEDKIVKAIEFRPGNAQIVHHALMFEDTEGVAAMTDAQTPEYGFEGFGGFGDTNNDLGILDQKQYPGFVPGQKPLRYPDGMGQTMAAGSDLVVQVHYAPWPTTETDLSHVNIFFADEDEQVDRFVEDSIMLPINLPPYGYPGFLAFTIPAETVKEFHGILEVEDPVSIMGVSPHMHLLGQDWKVWVEHTDGRISNLIKIPEWDFNWQGNYFFPKLIVAEAGAVIHAVATYDNTSENPSNPSNPPVFVAWGEGTTDEMYYLPIMYVPYQAGDENVVFDNVLDVQDQEIEIVNNQLYPISPNPVNENANIHFNLQNAGPVSLEIVDIQGKIVRSLRTNEFFSIGDHFIPFKTDALNPGAYFINLKGKHFNLSEKFIKI